MEAHTEQLLYELGYRLAEDAWADEGRKTYVNSEDADREFVNDLRKSLVQHGWEKHETVLRAFRNTKDHETLEIEVGGPDTSGHFLHLMMDR
jgi:hypothetical protein